MNDLKKVDEAIKAGYQKAYPYDANLWSSMEGGLDAIPMKRNKSWLALLFLGLTAVTAVIIFFPSQTQEMVANKEVNIATESAHSSPVVPETARQETIVGENGTSIPETIKSEPMENGKVNDRTKQGGSSPIGIGTETQSDLPPVQKDSGVDISGYQWISLPEFSNSRRGPAALFDGVWGDPSDVESASKHIIKTKKQRVFFQYETLVSVAGSKHLGSNQLGSNVQKVRLESEVFSKSMESNLLVGIGLRRVYFMVGLGYKTIHEKVNYNHYEIETSSEIIEGPFTILKDKYAIDGKVVTLLGREKETITTADTTSQVLYSGVNRYAFVKVPMRFGFIKRINHLVIEPSISSDWILNRSFRGTYIASGLDKIYQNGSLPGLNTFGVEGGLGLQVSYFFTSNMRFGASVQHREMLTSTHRTFNQKYSTTYLGWFVNKAF